MSLMVIAHLTSSPFFGGPERQMLGLARAIRPEHQSVFIAFAEGGKCEGLLNEAGAKGFEAIRLKHNYPRAVRVVREIAWHLKRTRASILCCHGYKGDLIGLAAARLARLPVVSVSHGWTAATWKVRFNEFADKRCLRWMNAVVAVCAAQETRVLEIGLSPGRVTVIHNALDFARFEPQPAYVANPLQAIFPSPRSAIVLAIGRLSREKGFSDLIEAAAIVARTDATIGFVIVGHGPLQRTLAQQIAELGLPRNVILTGFRNDIEQILPHADMLAIASHSEGLPTVLLEAFAAGVPVVATPVGGIPEVLKDGINGILTPAGRPDLLAKNVARLLRDLSSRTEFGQRGMQTIRDCYSFEVQKQKYLRLFESLLQKPPAVEPISRASGDHSEPMLQALGEGGVE